MTNLGNGIGATSIHPGGRLAAVGSPDGVVLFDLETGRILDRLAISNRINAVSFDGTASLLTNGFEGFFRWPVRADAAKPGRWTIGPPERLPFQLGDMTIATSRDGVDASGHGGAVASDGTLSITGSTFIGNQALGAAVPSGFASSQGLGGGVIVFDTATISNSSLDPLTE